MKMRRNSFEFELHIAYGAARLRRSFQEGQRTERRIFKTPAELKRFLGGLWITHNDLRLADLFCEPQIYHNGRWVPVTKKK
jgi:hypothetical protein